MRWPWSKKKDSDAISNPTLESDSMRGAAPPSDNAPPAPVREPPTMSEAVTAEPLESEGSSPEPLEGEAGSNSPPTGLEQRIVESLKTVYDPEIPVDIYELGLIYEVDVREANSVYLKMTLTSPMCPVAETLPPEVEEKVRMVDGVSSVELELVWDPPWNPDMMSEAAKLELNM